MKIRTIFPLLLLFTTSLAQTSSNGDALKIPEELEYNDEDEEHFQKDILVIPNRFPKELNFFCYPRTGLQHDRLCFGQLDAYALACADDTPPMHLVPFCLAFKGQCSKVNYPSEKWCKLEKKQYKKFCTLNKRQSCKSCHYDLSCSCEPYECIWRRFGFETARWCQRYELFCNQKARREKAGDLVSLMQDAVKVHYKCFHMFNLAPIICDPFKRQFDQQRCMKFLFDCELISDFEEEDPGKEVTEEAVGSSKEIVTVGGKGDKMSEKWATPEEAKQAKKIEEEEEKLAKQIAAAEAESKNSTHPFEKVRLLPMEPMKIPQNIQNSTNVTIVETQMQSKPTEAEINRRISGTQKETDAPPKNPFRNRHFIKH